MYKQLLLVFIVLVFQVICTKIEPRDLIDEAQKQLDELNSLVQGSIFAAHDELNNLATDFITYSNNVVENGKLAIEEESVAIRTEINTLANLVRAAGKDPSPCTDVSEVLLSRLPIEHTRALVECSSELITESTRLLVNSLYIIDVNINKILNLENQLHRCGDSLVCIEPIVTEIQLDMIRLPASIKTEVIAAESQLSSVKLLVHQCSDVEVPVFISEANEIGDNAISCLNIILDMP